MGHVPFLISAIGLLLSVACREAVVVMAASPAVEEDCADKIGNGLFCSQIPSVCGEQLAQVLCRMTCGYCVLPPGATTQPPPTVAADQDPCQDNVEGGFTCDMLPGVCSSVMGQIVCRRACGFCQVRTTVPTTTSPPCRDVAQGGFCTRNSHVACQAATAPTLCAYTCFNCNPPSTPPPTTTQSAPFADDCFDNIGDGLYCSIIPGICSDQFAPVLCRKTCQACTPSPGSATTPPPDTPNYSTHDCRDNVVGQWSCNMLPGVCSDPVGKVICRKACGFCQDVTTTTEASTTMSSGPCVDYLGGGLKCEQLPGMCGDPYAKVVCKRACRFCTPSPSDPIPPDEPMSLDECKDNVQFGLTCSAIPNVCNDAFGKIFCRLSCGQCVKPTTPVPTTTPPANVNCFDNLGGGLTCANLPGVCNDMYAQVVCRRSCGFCTPAAGATNPPDEPMTLDVCKDNVMYGLTCNMLSGVCGDAYAQIYCRQSCGNCTETTTTTSLTTHTTSSTTTTASVPCMDYMGAGLRCEHLPGMCGNIYAKIVCQRACGYCTPSPDEPSTTPDTEPLDLDVCTDNLIHGLHCAEVPGVCEDTFGQIYCRQHCGTCKTTTPLPTTTTPPPPTTTTPEPTTTPIPEETCFDHLGGGLKCAHLPGICSDQYARVLCAKACGFCHTNPLVPTSPATTEETMRIDTCEDNVVNNLNCGILPGVCNDNFGKVYCRQSCGTCATASTAATTILATTTPRPATSTPSTEETCFDHLGGGLKCEQLPGICSDPFARVVCARACRFCQPNPYAPTTTPEPDIPMTLDVCIDNVVGTLNCSSLNGICNDAFGKIYCRQTCGECLTTTVTTPPPTTTTPRPTTTTPRPTTTTPRPTQPPEPCVDRVINGLHCNQLPNVCGDMWAKVVCRRFCKFCIPTHNDIQPTSFANDTLLGFECLDHLDLYDCATLPNVCSDQYGQIICRKTCDVCITTTTATTTNRLSSDVQTQQTQAPTTTATPQTTTTSSVSQACADNLHGHGLTCTDLGQTNCQSPLAGIVCRRTCGFCVCEDKIEGMTCQELKDVYGVDPCSDTLGDEVCPKFCGFCPG